MIAAVITAALAVRAVVRGEGAAVGVRDAGRDGRVRALLCAGRDLAAQIAAVDEQGEPVRICARSVCEKALSAGSLMEKQRLYVPSWLTVRNSGA